MQSLTLTTLLVLSNLGLAFMLLIAIARGNLALRALDKFRAQFSGDAHTDASAGTGGFVAEVLMDWGVGPSAAMYRQRFPSQELALKAARNAAWQIRQSLPTHFGAEAGSGAQLWESFEFKLRFGARAMDPAELALFTPVYRSTMPEREAPQAMEPLPTRLKVTTEMVRQTNREFMAARDKPHSHA